MVSLFSFSKNSLLLNSVSDIFKKRRTDVSNGFSTLSAQKRPVSQLVWEVHKKMKDPIFVGNFTFDNFCKKYFCTEVDIP